MRGCGVNPEAFASGNSRTKADNIEDSIAFLQGRFGDDAPGQIVLFTIPDERAYWLDPWDQDSIRQTLSKIVPTHNVYFSVSTHNYSDAVAEWHRRNPAHPGLCTTRGFSVSSQALAGMWGDFDVASPVHKGEHLPRSKDQVLDFLLNKFPLRPSLIWDSGYGLQADWWLREIWRFENENERNEAATFAQQWIATLQYYAQEDGWSIDPSVKDLARVLRLPGTFNRKLGQALPVTIIHSDDSARYNQSDFSAIFVAPGVKTKPFSAKTTAEQKRTLTEAQAALQYLSANDYELWLKIGMALHSLNSGEEFYPVWKEWSAPFQAKFHYAECRHTWSTFHTPEPGDTGKITIASLFAVAIEKGWRNTGNDTNGTVHATEKLPKIQTNNQPLRIQSEEALEALQAKNNPPFLFYRGGDPVRIVKDERQRPTIEIVGESALRGYLTRSAEFYRVTEKKGEWVQTQVSPPLDVVRDILTLPEKPFPALVSITECPVLRLDGTIFNTPGYDPITRHYYEPAFGLHVPPIADMLREADARAARDFIQKEVLCDFSFVEQADIANMIACLLTPIVRPAITGNVPLCLLNKPVSGSGATLLADVVATIATGQHAAKETMPEGKYSGEEARKKATSILLAGSPIVVFDNIEDNLTSNALVVMLTTPLWSDRILGESRQITLPVQATWIATGNNISVRGDLARRCYHVRIDPQVERPWTRDGFRHPDLLAWIREHRGQLLAALLTMARAWFVAGQPKAKMPKLGGFEAWTRITGGILEYAGIPGFLDNLEELYSQVEDEGPQWTTFLETWFEEIGNRPVTVRYLAGLLSGQPGFAL